MSEMHPFDRTSYGEPSKYDVTLPPGRPVAREEPSAAAPEAELGVPVEHLTKNGQAGAVLLLAFLHELEVGGLPHAEALYLAAHVWQLT